MGGSDFPLAAAIHALITVGDVEEKVLFVMLLTKKEEVTARLKMQKLRTC